MFPNVLPELFPDEPGERSIFRHAHCGAGGAIEDHQARAVA
jgi:hypothetical protein